MPEMMIPEDVMEGIMAVRESGATNMIECKGVMYAAEQLGYDETADWLRHRENRDTYRDWFVGRHSNAT
jgi:hypothetical protein